MLGIKKYKRINYEKVMREFDANNRNKKNYNKINEIYSEIKKCYNEKIKEENFDIKIEKILIEYGLGKIENKFTSFSIAFYITTFGTIFYFMIQNVVNGINISNKFISTILISLILVGFMIFIIHITGKNIRKETPRDLMLNISLQVLEDLEKEMKEEK